MSKGLLEEAAKIACRGDSRSFYLGCVIKRKDGAIVSSANGRLKIPCPDGHAEAKALRKAGKGAKVLCVARILKSTKEWAMAKPCKECQKRIRSMNVKKVYYTIGPNEYGVWYP